MHERAVEIHLVWRTDKETIVGRDERLVFEIPKMIGQQKGYLFSQYNPL